MKLSQQSLNGRIQNATRTPLPNRLHKMKTQVHFLRSGGSSAERGSAMKKSAMQKLAVACLAAFAALGTIAPANGQTHGGGGFHGGGASHGGGFHGGSGFHGGGGFHGGDFHGRSHGSFFIGAPIVFGPGYYPYDYSYPYELQDSGSNYWYCPNPAGYYPDVQTCPSGWLQVVPNS
jgi:hypothetical protein